MKYRILGLDMSMGSPGFAVVDIVDGTPELLHLSHLKTVSSQSHGQRLIAIEQHLIDITKRFGRFDLVAREKGFSMRAMTTQVIFRVVGVSDLTLAKYGYIKIYEYPPTTVKKQMTGNGKASKQEVEDAVSKIFTGAVFATDDESDAVAVALTCAYKEGLL